MEALKLSNPAESPRRLSQSVVQVTQMLGMYNAELARILGCQCNDVGKLVSGQHCLEPDTIAWQNALDFVAMYQALYERHKGNSVAMYHWLRADNDALCGIPHLLMVDDKRLKDILRHLQTFL